MGSKYDPLQWYLLERAASHREISLSLDQIEAIIGATLPDSARKYRDWWSNQSDVSRRPNAKAWMDAGYKVELVGPKSVVTSVRFIRQ
jgi:hypothetical protein